MSDDQQQQHPPGQGHGQYGTARLIAYCRAKATTDPNLGKICDDPYASAFAQDGAKLCEALERSGAMPEFHVWVAGRTAFFDTCVREAVERQGIDQVVLLGAGYDTRSNRLGLNQKAKFFEVDLPQTQNDKLKIIKEKFSDSFSVERSVYVSCDFESQDFMDRLTQHGFDRSKRAIFVIEGVLYYLTEAAVNATLSKISAENHPNTIVVFDMFSKTAVFGNAQQVKAAQGELKSSREPMLWGSNHILPFLFKIGYRFVQHHDMDEVVLAGTGSHQYRRQFRFQYVVVAMKERPADGAGGRPLPPFSPLWSLPCAKL